MDIKSGIQRLIVLLWNRQYRLAYEEPNTLWTRMQRKALRRVAEMLRKLV